VVASVILSILLTLLNLLLMPWYPKTHNTPFDHTTINGIFILDGDVVADALGKDWTRGQRMPMIAFPSGFACEIWPSFLREDGALVHLFGEMDLPLFHTLDEAYAQASVLAEQYGYCVQLSGSRCMSVWRQTPLTYLEVRYDSDARRMVDVRHIQDPYVD
jgi:hypothetical protein